MEIKDILEKIKVAFSSSLTKEEKEFVKNNQVKLAAEIAAAGAPPPPPAAKKKYSANVTGGAPMVVDISDDGIEGVDQNDAVFTDDAMTIPYPDGDYPLDNGSTVTVAGGKVTAVKPEIPAVNMAAAVKQMEAKFSEQKTAIEKSYDLKLAAHQTKFSEEIKGLKEVVLANTKLLDKLINTPIDTIKFSEAKKSVTLSAEEYEKLSNRDKVKYNRGEL